jgi:hypothetical protein
MIERQKNIEKFQNNPECRFFCGTTQTGGYGITLTAASTMIYYSNGYDLEKRQQSEARIDRIGQKYPMTYIDIMCEKTVDERIVKALKAKVNIASQIMGEELKGLDLTNYFPARPFHIWQVRFRNFYRRKLKLVFYSHLFHYRTREPSPQPDHLFCRTRGSIDRSQQLFEIQYAT